MCEPKPGPRCSADTRRELATARKKLAQAQRDYERHPDDEDARRRADQVEKAVKKKLAAYDSSPEGQRKLKEQLESSPTPNSPENDSLRTRIYTGRKTRTEQKKALARARGKSADEERMEVDHMLGRLRQPDGGFTVDTSTSREQTMGFFVSCHPERESVHPVETVRRSDIRGFVKNNADLLNKDGHFYGAWHDPETGNLYLDISIGTESAEEARTVAKENDQIAFFDGQTMNSVRADGKNEGQGE